MSLLNISVSISSISFSRPPHDRRVVVHHAVDDRVQDRLRPKRQQLGVGFHPPAHTRQVAALAMPHRDHEILADEHVQLGEFDLLAAVDVAGRPQDGEEDIVVALDLRALVRHDRVLDRELVDAELPRHLAELGLVRLLQPDPGDTPDLPAGVIGGFDRVGFQHPLAFDVDGIVNDHARSPHEYQEPAHPSGAGHIMPRGPALLANAQSRE
jgi:hypothetical protein